MIKKSVLLSALAIAGFAVTSLAQTVPSNVPTNGLVGWWPFNGNAIDESVNTNDGTVNGATLTADRFGTTGKAYSFNGTSNNIEIANAVIAAFNSNSFSAAVWFKTNMTNTGNFIRYDNCISNSGWGMRIGRMNVTTSAGIVQGLEFPANRVTNYVNSTLTYNNNQWHHAVFSRNISTMKDILYIDGVLIAQTTFTVINQLSNTGSVFRFGSCAGFEYYSGSLDDIGIWNRALTPQEITDLYQSCSNPPTASITPQGNTTFCQGNSVILAASTGTGNTYQWYANNSAISTATNANYSATQSGSYSLVITNGACTATSSAVQVTVNNLPTVTANVTNSVVCLGQTTTLSGGGASTYVWTGGITDGVAFTPTATANYTVTGTGANGCTNTASRQITVNNLPTVTMAPLTSFVNINATPISLSGNPSGGTYSGTGVTGNVFNPLNAGLGVHHVSYSYVDANGCGAIANNNTIVYDTLGTVCTSYDTVLVSVTDTLIINTFVTGVNPPNNNNTIKVFPNPANDHITVDYGNYVMMNGYSVKITNALGQVVFISGITQQSSYINLASWTGNGIYFVNIINPQGNTIDIRKIVLQ